MPADDSGITVRTNSERNGIEISFPDHPGQVILTEIKAAGFRWHPKRKLWWAKRNQERTEVAEKLKGGRL